MLLALALALFLTQARSHGATMVQFLTNKISPVNVIALAVLTVFWPILLEANGLFRPWRLRSFQSESRVIFRTVSIGAFAFLIMVVAFQRTNVTPRTVATFWLLAFVGTLLVHLGFDRFARRMRHVSRRRQVLIVGSGSRARRLARNLESRKDLASYRLLGFVDDASGQGFQNGAELVCSIAELPAFLKDHVVDEVIITLPLKSQYQRIWEVSKLCEEQGIPVRVPSDLFDLKIASRGVAELGGETVLTFYTGATPKPFSAVAKRIMDVAGSAGLLLLLSPLLLIVALAIKVTSPGPVLFKQERLGINKRRFQVLKFRTMVQDAERQLPDLEALNEAEGPVFKLWQDPRMTPIGPFLRRTSIDELPQLINVLKGEMSLVGPRPLPIRDVVRIEEAWQKRRFSVKPGITCLWQVNGRSNVRFQEWVKMDLHYIDEWSLGLDLKILMKTIPAVFRGEGAA